MAQESGLIPNPQPITIGAESSAPQIMFARAHHLHEDFIEGDGWPSCIVGA
jgi:hypothetical protein